MHHTASALPARPKRRPHLPSLLSLPALLLLLLSLLRLFEHTFYTHLDPPPVPPVSNVARALRETLYAPLLAPNLQNDTTNAAHLVHKALLPPVFVSRLGATGRRKLLHRLTISSSGDPSFATMPRVLIADLQNGLGNRLRALGSAMEFAYNTRRVLVVLWAADAHLNATMADLFHPELLQNLIVINAAVGWPIDLCDVDRVLGNGSVAAVETGHASLGSLRVYNFMAKDAEFEGSGPKSVEDERDKHVYVKTAYVLSSRYVQGELVNVFMRNLRPAPEVMELVQGVEQGVGGMEGLVGVHVRSRRIGEDNEGVDYECEYSVEGAAITDRWRGMSGPGNFVGEMRRVGRVGIRRAGSLGWLKWMIGIGGRGRERVRFYVSADSRATLEMMEGEFEKGEIVHLERGCDDRGRRCILYAFADIILLSRTGMLLASGWSSFSEAAVRIREAGGERFEVRTSGIDFGRPGGRIGRIFSWLGLQLWKGTRVLQRDRRKACQQKRQRG